MAGFKSKSQIRFKDHRAPFSRFALTLLSIDQTTSFLKSRTVNFRSFFACAAAFVCVATRLLKAPRAPGKLSRMLPVRFLFVIALFAAMTVGAAERTIQFSRMKADEPPPGFRSALTGEGRLGVWKIIETEVPSPIGSITEKAESPRQKVLAQTSRDLTENRYP